MRPRPILLPFLVLLCGTHLAAAQAVDVRAQRANDKEILSWLRQNAIPIRSTEAGTGFADLLPLKKTLRDVRIVGLGEATHGTREFFQFRHRLIEFLVTELQFNAFALEASFAASEPINEYVLYGRGDRASVLSGQGYVAWDTEEFAAMLDWLRTYNQQVPDERKVRFYGADPVYNDFGREKVLRYLTRYGPARVPATDSLFRSLSIEEAKWPMQIDEPSRAVLQRALPQLDDLIDHLSSGVEGYSSRSSQAELNEMMFYLRLMKQFAQMVTRADERSSMMAQNVMYLVDRGGAAVKMMVWAHNFHVSKDGPAPKRMGYLLHQRYDKQYYAFGFDFNQGAYVTRVLYPGHPSGEFKIKTAPPAPEGSLPSYLARTNIGNLLLDLRSPPKNRVIAQWLDAPRVIHEATWGYRDSPEMDTVNIRSHYDGMIFIERTTATNPTPNAREAVAKREKF